MVISSYMNIFISTWVLLVAGLVFALPMIHMRVKDTTEEADEMYVFVTFFLSCLSSATALASWRSCCLKICPFRTFLFRSSSAIFGHLYSSTSRLRLCGKRYLIFGYRSSYLDVSVFSLSASF